MINYENVLLRRLKDCDNDYKLLEKWYKQEEIYLHFEQRILNLDEIKNKYYPRTLDNATVPVYMIEYNQKTIGIIQYQLVSDENKKLYKIDNSNCYEIDIFIGEIECHNKGIGKKSIELMCDYLFKNKNADILVMCPLKENKKAINCYLNCGFKIKDEFNTENTIGELKTFVLMIKAKDGK